VVALGLINKELEVLARRVAIIGSLKRLEFIDDNSTSSVDIDMIPMTVFARGHVVTVSITLCVHDLIAR